MDELFPEEAQSADVISFVPEEPATASSRSLVLSAGAFLLAVTATVLFLTLDPDRVVAGSSTLGFDWEAPTGLTLEYETVSPLAAESRLRARLRYWVPDSLRFAQTEPGYSVIELSRDEPGVFSGTAELSPGAVYAVAVVEDFEGDYIDNDFGRLWEYLETDELGRPTLQARRYQLLATTELSVARAAAVAEEAAAQFPHQPEFQIREMLLAQSAVPPESRDAFLREHAERLARLDRAGREGDPGPVELDALHRYATFLDQPDLASYWSSRLISRYPQHGAAALVRLRSIVSAGTTTRTKLEDLEDSWARARAPATAQVGLRLSIELADPALTSEWLDRHSAVSVFRDLIYDTELARDLTAVPALRPIAEAWIIERLADSRSATGPERPLDQSRSNFRAEVSRHRAHLNLSLARLRLARGQSDGAIVAVERSVAQTWSPDVFLGAAAVHRSAGSDLRAIELLALSQVDPIIPPRPRPSADALGDLPEPSEEQLATARTTMYERVTSSLLDEHLDLSARLRFSTGEETTLREIVLGNVVIVVQAVHPGSMPDETFALLDANSQRLDSAGVRTVFIGQQPVLSRHEDAEMDPRFLHDVRSEAWDSLRAWRAVQYFVLDPSGRLRHRGENLEAALRISLVLPTRAGASADVVLNREETDT